MADTTGWMRHDDAAYAQALAALLPVGAAWPRDADSVLMQFVGGVAAVWGLKVDPRAGDLIERETDPRRTFELLDEWERAFGLPDECLAEPLTIADRQKALVQRLTMLGGQSRAFFVAVAAAIGYTIRITEYAPFICGISECGDTSDEFGDPRWQLGSEEIRYYWTVHVDTARLTWFRVGDGGGEVGVDHLLEIGLATDLECLLRRLKPAHTQIVFDYSGLASGGPEAGLP